MDRLSPAGTIRRCLFFKCFFPVCSRVVPEHFPQVVENLHSFAVKVLDAAPSGQLPRSVIRFQGSKSAHFPFPSAPLFHTNYLLFPVVRKTAGRRNWVSCQPIGKGVGAGAVGRDAPLDAPAGHSSGRFGVDATKTISHRQFSNN
uniref:(northern house mosquito) hypothetical protein n=1 Tax=Culex pipiens TaxID=7175 RepID=A0A8D8DYE4_CULPI